MLCFALDSMLRPCFTKVHKIINANRNCLRVRILSGECMNRNPCTALYTTEQILGIVKGEKSQAFVEYRERYRRYRRTQWLCVFEAKLGIGSLEEESALSRTEFLRIHSENMRKVELQVRRDDIEKYV